MPKFFKRDILAQTPPDQPAPAMQSVPEQAPAPELAQDHSTDPFAPTASQPGHHSNYQTWHDPVPNTMEHIFTPQEMKEPAQHSEVPPQPTEDHQPAQPTQFTEEEPMLPSPLDTPELPPAHSASEMLTPPQSEYLEAAPPTEVAELPEQAENYPPAENNLNPELTKVETLLSWRAPSRPHRKKDRSFYTTVGILIILIALIALLAGEKMLVAVLFALMFLVYVINFIEPQEIEYRLSTQGVTVDNHFYHWQELDSFWFDQKDGYTVLHILTQLHFPGILMLVLAPTTSEDQVKKTVVRFLPYHEIAPKSLIDKWAESLQKHFPLENPHK